MTTYLIISNAIFVILFLLVLLEYFGLKKSSRKEIESQLQKTNDLENRLNQAPEAENKKLELIIAEISQLRKEKEQEIKTRFEAEKQIVLAIQKSEDIQKRMIDWKVAQESAMQDAQNAIFQVGEDLYQRLSANHLTEIKNNQNLLEQILRQNTAADIKEEKKSFDEGKISQAENQTNLAENKKTREDISKKFLAQLTKSMVDSEHIEGEQYFLNGSFEADKAKLFLCEAAFLQDANFYIFDFKGCNFLDEYNQSADKSLAQKTLEQKLDKYIAYLANPKYRAAILKAVDSKNIKFETGDIIFVVASEAEIALLESIGYLEKMENSDIKIATFDEIIDLTL